MSTTSGFKKVMEVQPDTRRRVSLGKVARHTRYAVEVTDDGEIRLIPLVSIPTRDLETLTKP